VLHTIRTALGSFFYTHVKKPARTVDEQLQLLNNPTSDWFSSPLLDVQKKKPFLIISTLVYLCNIVFPGNGVKDKILELIRNNPNVPVYKLGFLNNWNQQPVWS
jgi:hypothetical protein